MKGRKHQRIKGRKSQVRSTRVRGRAQTKIQRRTALGSRASKPGSHFDAPELWHDASEDDRIQIVAYPPGDGYQHAVTVEQVRDRIEQLPERFRRNVSVVQLSPMTRKRRLFPCYGLQWGQSVYLYPIEESLVERFVKPPRPVQQVEAKMYGGKWVQAGEFWELHWTPQAIQDFYLNNVLIHEIGHANDDRNTSYVKRERYANWFADEYGYRASRGRRMA